MSLEALRECETRQGGTELEWDTSCFGLLLLLSHPPHLHVAGVGELLVLAAIIILSLSNYHHHHHYHRGLGSHRRLRQSPTAASCPNMTAAKSKRRDPRWLWRRRKGTTNRSRCATGRSPWPLLQTSAGDFLQGAGHVRLCPLLCQYSATEVHTSQLSTADSSTSVGRLRKA